MRFFNKNMCENYWDLISPLNTNRESIKYVVADSLSRVSGETELEQTSEFSTAEADAVSCMLSISSQTVSNFLAKLRHANTHDSELVSLHARLLNDELSPEYIPGG